MWTLDFETEAIEGNISAFPPKPVGLAVRGPTGEQLYITEPERMKVHLQAAWPHPKVFHNAKFDTSVAMHWFGMPMPDPLTIHDTQYLIFLNDPHAVSLSLKPSAQRILGEAPEEQDRLRDWILAHIPEATKKNFGAYICKTPHEIVAPYALGDVGRTWRLYEKLMPIIKAKGMEEAYQREQRLMPILYGAEKRGLRVDIHALGLSIDRMASALKEADARIYNLLGSSFNVDSSAELAQALDAAGMIKEWRLTPTGARSMAKEALQSSVSNPEVLKLLLYRSGLDTCLNTFGISWYNQAMASKGRLHPNWNQVRQEGQGNSFKGTRTGRLSCDHPNLTNPPGELKVQAPIGFESIPQMRRFLLPEEGHVWVKRDFSSQEIRILAHYEDGELMRAYQENPLLDPHKMAQDLILRIAGLELPRKDVKITAFSTIYGAGVSGLASQLGCDAGRAKAIREAYMEAIPGIRILGNALRTRGRNGLALKTWGGRQYLPEAPRIVNGAMRSFEYKLLNYLIQGSAADQTKQAIIDWNAEHDAPCLFLAALHDEINISVPEDNVSDAMYDLKNAMNAPRFDVEMLSEGLVGPNFGELSVVVS